MEQIPGLSRGFYKGAFWGAVISVLLFWLPLFLLVRHFS